MNTISALAQEGSVRVSRGRHALRRRHSAAEQPPTATRRTTLTFDSTGTARVGMMPKHGRAIAEFADLTQRTRRQARVGHRALSSADLVALVAECLITEVRRDCRAADAGVTLTYPAGYDEDLIAELRAALDAVGLGQVVLVAEPVAAVTWLEAARGPLMPGLTLVYDLGGAGLDVTLVRVGAGRSADPIVGTSLRSPEFGGRAFGAMVAERGGRGIAPAAGTGGVAGATADQLRTEHVRRSLGLVYRCLRTADVTMADVDCVLVVGGAARPAEVSEVLAAELARPVIMAPDPERTIANGAAIMARRTTAAAEEGSKPDGAKYRGTHRRVATVPALLTRWTRLGRTKFAVAAGMSAGGIGLALALPADAVVAGLAELGVW
ncbi:Hsp70 family protein [Nocardia australiensis]|uniref:Hsp70 family protein n=1 Tax=Nocardia australiensis TaxID=2887191 RepID=UPI001D1359E0|nr:Hsp70 family protein [Nocardia australiensis]